MLNLCQQSFAASDMASPYYLNSNVWNLQDDLVTPSGSAFIG